MTSNPDPSRDARLGIAVAEYYRLVEDGSFNRNEFLASYTDLSQELKSFLESLDEVQWLTPRDRGHAAETPSLSSSAPRCQVQRHLGDYELLGEIGRGGMGVVYKAWQESLQRLVAIKMIRSGPSASNEDVQRLHSEAQLAASLRHPHIVSIHEVSKHDGVHYFSMDLVDGTNLAERIRENPLAPMQAAHCLKTIAEAVHFAHQKGILHRDLKPANILLDDQGQPHVTDFGLARQIESDSNLTRSGEIVGTACYMAPEQATEQAKMLTPSVDVYSLGAILYEMLTGRPPFKATTAIETLLLVRDADPVPPRRLQPKVPVDLETICLKCIEKHRDKRYPSAQELAEDLHRFIDGQPVRARPISRIGRCARWSRRNPVVAALSAAIGLLMVASLLGLTGLWLSADRQRALAEENSHKEEEQRQRAEANFEKAQEVVNRYLTQVSEEKILNEPHMKPLRQRLLLLAQQYYQEFVAQHADDSQLQADLGLAYARLAKITADIDSKSKAIELGQKAVAVLTALHINQPTVPKYRIDLATCYSDLGVYFRATGQLAQAEESHKEALAICDALAHEYPNEALYRHYFAQSHNYLGGLYRGMGRMDQAVTMLDRSLPILEELVDAHPDEPSYQDTLAMNLRILGSVRTDLSQIEEAEHCFRRSIEIWTTLAGDFPNVNKYKSSIAGMCYNLALLYDNSHRPEEAEASHNQAVQIYEQLCRDNPSDTGLQDLLSATYNNLGVHFSVARKPVQAEQSFLRSFEISNRLAGNYPDVPTYQNGLARSSANLGEVLLENGKLVEARKHTSDAIATFEKLAQNHAEQWEFTINLAAVSTTMAIICRKEGILDEARKWHDGAIGKLHRVLEQQPKSLGARTCLCEAYAKRANTMAILGDRELALTDWDSALELDTSEGKYQLRVGRAKTLVHFREYALAASEMSTIVAAKDLAADMRYDLACTYVQLAAAVRDDPVQADNYIAQAVDLLRQSSQTDNSIVERAQNDHSLDDIREHENFERLLQDWREKQREP